MKILGGRHAEAVPNAPDDEELITRCRAEGDPGVAFGHLYERHVDAARRLALRLARDPSGADDLVAESFTRVLSALRREHGPDAAFRPYLLTVVRNVARDWAAGDKRLLLVEEYDALEKPDAHGDDPVIEQAERELAARAFAELPERWRAVLWHTEVEGDSPAAIAPLLGMSANAVAALALRAREGLRQGYLKAHMADEVPQECRDHADGLARFARGRLARGKRAAVQAHLDGCGSCHTLYAELVRINTGLGSLIGPIVLGPAAAAYAAGGSGALTGVGAWLSRLRPRSNPTTAAVVGTAAVVVAATAFAAVHLTGDDAPPSAAAPAPSTSAPAPAHRPPNSTRPSAHQPRPPHSSAPHRPGATPAAVPNPHPSRAEPAPSHHPPSPAPARSAPSHPAPRPSHSTASSAPAPRTSTPHTSAPPPKPPRTAPVRPPDPPRHRPSRPTPQPPAPTRAPHPPPPHMKPPGKPTPTPTCIVLQLFCWRL